MTARRSFKWVFATALLVSSLSRIASAAPVTSIVVYGDSLSDNGNLFSATGQPPAPYFAGRASDGPVTVELLAGSLGVPLLDFAWFGATTGIGNSVDGGTPTSSGFLSLPGMQTQFLASQPFLGPHIENGLFVVWGGANDVVSPSPFDTTPQDIIARAVGNMLGIVSALQGLGVQLILVPGLPDLGLSPRVAALGPAAVAQATAFTDAFNLALTAGLPSDVLFYDTAAVLRSIVANPAAFGLSNVTTPCFNGVTVCADPSQYLFWDDVHTTTAANAVFANEMEKLLPVPEPAMLALTGIGLAAAGVRRYRRRA
jgi:phospholipase/lecithinase/hemolysin